MGFDGADVAGVLLDAGVTEGKGLVLDVTVLRVVAVLLGGCTIDGVPIGFDTTLFGSTMSEDWVNCAGLDRGRVSDVVPLYNDPRPLEAETDRLGKSGWRMDVVERVTMAGGTEAIAELGAKLGC